MKDNITTIADVIHFFDQLLAEGCVFHPDDDFDQYGTYTDDDRIWAPAYTVEETEHRNNLLHQAWATCKQKGVDIYSLAICAAKKSRMETFYNY